VTSVLPVVLLALAGFCFGGAYALATQKKPWWAVVLVAALGLLSLTGGWLYL
jgi:dienelactone hydrolase